MTETLHVGYTRNSHKAHVVPIDRPWYFGMTARSLCGVKVSVEDRPAAPNSPAACQRCRRKVNPNG